ncbi:MAG: 1-(5-phosphoribosyl)-5-[(5-phosphoribosylamino)methylideneamino]imidazole-4-carboxamide isomerase [Candidatus Omnitrophica bacterium]|nr:1-(5-phosphoribosyl)-5-[(5-phosphoribosylamino)methylideneamino]imidazole-4-carboxamide isomerase [Candidatus Omnitrophota bacterium]
MIPIPAIDLKNNKVVRLYKGKFDEATAYELTPVDAAQKWIDLGAKWLHVVDLDGAQTGEMKNLNSIKEIIKKFGNVPVQVGGGVRSDEAIKKLLDLGAARVILGTKAVPDERIGAVVGTMWELSNEVLQYGEDKIAVSLDCLDGHVTQRGWTETSPRKGTDLAKYLESVGIKTIIYTDIARDGTLQGPNFEGIISILDEVNVKVIASGGISSLQDMEKLKTLTSKKGNVLWGAITGKAIYEGKLDFKKAMDICLTNA